MNLELPTTTQDNSEEKYAICNLGHTHRLRAFVKHIAIPANMPFPQEFVDAIPVSGAADWSQISPRLLEECPMPELQVMGWGHPPLGIHPPQVMTTLQPPMVLMKAAPDGLRPRRNVTWADEALANEPKVGIPPVTTTNTSEACSTQAMKPLETIASTLTTTTTATAMVSTYTAHTTTASTAISIAQITETAMPTRAQILARLESLERAMTQMKLEVASMRQTHIDRPLKEECEDYHNSNNG